MSTGESLLSTLLQRRLVAFSSSRSLFFCYLLVSLPTVTTAQEPTPNLAAFFQQRLSGSVNTPPSYEALLRVIDTIPGSDPRDIATALPFLSTALTSAKENLPVEAAFALFVISQRSDGGALLRTRVPEIGALLERPDDRLSGGAILTLRYLTPSNSDLTVPMIMKHLNGPAKPSLVKLEIMSMLLKFKRDDPQVIKTIETFLTLDAEPAVRIATLQALGTNRVSTPGITEFTVQSVQYPSKYVKIAAIYAAHALGSEVWERAQPVVSRLAVDPSEDPEVRTVADRELRNTLVTGPQ
jgi:hypothetical protein